ncbi:unnamed protein product, partial [Amoebophrya sp. A25]
PLFLFFIYATTLFAATLFPLTTTVPECLSHVLPYLVFSPRYLLLSSLLEAIAASLLT